MFEMKFNTAPIPEKHYYLMCITRLLFDNKMSFENLES